MTKIRYTAHTRNQQQDYLAEQARQTFLNRLAGLLEIHSVINGKTGNKGVWLERSQVEIIQKWLLDTAAGLAGDYEAVHQANRWMARRVDHLTHCVNMYRGMRALQQYPFCPPRPLNNE